MKKQTFEGQWKIPGASSWVGGKVEYVPTEGIILDAVDSLTESYGAPERPDRIWGTTTDGNRITLINNSSTNSTVHIGRISPTNYRCELMLEGVHWPNINLGFDRMSVRFPLLNQWAGMAKSSTNDSLPQDEFLPGDQLSYSFTKPDDRTATVDGTHFRIGTGAGISTKEGGYSGVDFDLTTVLQIIPREPMLVLSRYNRHIQSLKRFLSFALDRPIEPTSITGYLDGETKYDNTSINIYSRVSVEQDYTAPIHPHSAMFLLDQIQSDFDEMLNNWYQLSNDLDSVISLYFSSVFNSEMYANNQFLTLTQAIESYHRETHAGRYIDKRVYDEMYEDLMNLLAGDPAKIDSLSSVKSAQNLNQYYSYNPNSKNRFKQHMRDGTLKYANQYSLKARLDDLTSEYQHLLSDIEYNIIGDERSIVDIRNYLTHYDDDGGKAKEVANSNELIPLVWGLQQLLEVCLLSEMDIGHDIISESIGNKYENRKTISGRYNINVK